MDGVNELPATLRERGLRVTPQRRQVLAAVDALGHATAEQVCAHVQTTAPSFSLSTVYRTLDLLEEIGLVTHAHLDHHAPTYHSRHGHEHLHTVCRCLLYTSDAADDLLCVDLGGRRIIKKKKNKHQQ